MRSVIVMLAKAPVQGEVKTRLGKSIGMAWSARFHRAFIADLCDRIAAVCRRQKGEVDALLCYAGDPDHVGFQRAKTLGFQFKEQPSGDLGERLTAVSREMLKEYDRVIIIGSDSPTLCEAHFLDAIATLEHSDVVIGPSFDGGYYLIGLRKASYDGGKEGLPIFSDIAWSSVDVLEQTLESCRRSHQRCELLGFWYDVDTVIDLNFLRTHLRQLKSVGSKSGEQTRALLKEFDHTAK